MGVSPTSSVKRAAKAERDMPARRARPVHLTDADDSAFESTKGEVRVRKISRQQVARFLVTAAQSPEYVGHSVALSG